MLKNVIDINADVGEGVGNESELLQIVSSCNIACGGHAGDEDTMRQVVRLAKQNNVKVGAHPSFPDKENFGREVMKISYAALFNSLRGQVLLLLKIIREEHYQLHHVKPHGALYNLAAKDLATAKVVVEVMKGIQLPLKLYVPYGSVIAELAIKENVPITYEAFADRNYNKDLSLVSRKLDNAIITDSEIMYKHVKEIVFNKKVTTVAGEKVDIKAETFCIHGDNPKALELAISLVQNLQNSGIMIQ